MAFLHRLKESFKEGLVTLTNAGDAPRRNDSHTRTLSKQSSKGKARSASVSFGFLESHIRDAIAAFVQDKIDKGEAKPHVFTQFWLQFPKLEAGFEVLRRQLEARTGSREGPLPLAVLQSAPRDFGIEEGSVMVRELCSKAATHKCTDIDFIGLVMLLLVVHLTEPASAASCSETKRTDSDPADATAATVAADAAAAASVPLHPDVRTMLSCLELAFTHFNSARKGKLDKREVAEALQYESAKAHMKEGARGRTSNRLAHRLFEGLDWEHDNTISFEDFLRGILQLVQDEFGDVSDGDDEAVGLEGAATAGGSGSGSATPSPPGEADGAAASGGAPTQPPGPRRCGSGRTDASTSQREGGDSYGPSPSRPRSSSATGMVTAAAAAAAGVRRAPSPGLGQRQETSPAPRPASGFLASLRGSFRKSAEPATTTAT